MGLGAVAGLAIAYPCPFGYCSSRRSWGKVLMNRIALIAAGFIVATALAIVVNLVTSGGPWWLWLVVAALVVAAVVIETARQSGRRAAAEHRQEINVGRKGQVTDSPQLIKAPGSESTHQMITARWHAIVRRSGQSIRGG